MIRRLIALPAILAAGWLLYTRILRQPDAGLGYPGDPRPDHQRRGVVERASGAAAGAASVAIQAARRIRTRQS
jgi:hypothetical protein